MSSKADPSAPGRGTGAENGPSPRLVCKGHPRHWSRSAAAHPPRWAVSWVGDGSTFNIAATESWGAD